MPYIKSDDGRREALQRGEPALTAGELNYEIFYYVKHCGFDRSVIECFVLQFFCREKLTYQKYNDMTGCLIRCYKEIKRRLNIDLKKEFEEIMESYDAEIAKYEDLKRDENGEV